MGDISRAAPAALRFAGCLYHDKPAGCRAAGFIYFSFLLEFVDVGGFPPRHGSAVLTSETLNLCFSFAPCGAVVKLFVRLAATYASRLCALREGRL